MGRNKPAGVMVPQTQVIGRARLRDRFASNQMLPRQGTTGYMRSCLHPQDAEDRRFESVWSAGERMWLCAMLERFGSLPTLASAGWTG
jgi:hypothetical protein